MNYFWKYYSEIFYALTGLIICCDVADDSVVKLGWAPWFWVKFFCVIVGRDRFVISVCALLNSSMESIASVIACRVGSWTSLSGLLVVATVVA